MKRLRREQVLILWLAAGILFAATGANHLFASDILDYREICEFLQKGWQAAAGREPAGTVRILTVRLLQTLTVVWLCSRKKRQVAFVLLPLVCGIHMAFIMVLATWYWGAAGILHALALWLPHEPCYLALWSGLLLYGIYGIQVQKKRFWSAMAVLFLSGILLEILIHPFVAGFI